MLIAPMHSLSQDDENDVQHDFSDHVTPLALVSVYCDAKVIISGTTAFVRF